MVRLFTLHKISGLTAGALLLLLAVTGFFLDHDKWQFLYTTTLSYAPHPLQKQESRLFEGYYIDPKNQNSRIACGKRGIFTTSNAGESFKRISRKICLGIRSEGEMIFAATSDGIFQIDGDKIIPVALGGEYVNAISVKDGKIFASVDKHRLYLIDAKTQEILKSATATFQNGEIGTPVTLARFVRDLHYGRGYFDGDISLLINDYGAVILAWLCVGGYLIWWRIKRRRPGKATRSLIESHANIFSLLAIFPLAVLAVTGIFLDHARGLGSFMKSVHIPSVMLPPVYRQLTHDIWSVDFDGRLFRVGNRYGVFKSDDLNGWQIESRGFAYRMFREEETLYVSGMGAPNRIYEKGEWRILKNSPHMFKDIGTISGERLFFSTHHPKVPLPRFETITLYTLLLGLHDGTFFAPWWVWINDIAAILLLILLFSGFYRWLARRKKRIRSVQSPKR